MSEIVTALEENKSAEEIRDAIIHDVTTPDPEGKTYKEIIANPETTAKFETICIWWLKLLANTYRTKQYDENNKQIAVKQYKAAKQVCGNPFMKVFLKRKNSFTGKAQDVVKLLAKEDGKFQNDWSRYAFFALQGIGGRLKNR